MMPLPFYALLCTNCNMNEGPFVVDSPRGRAEMLARSAELWGGWHVIEDAFDKWNTIVPNGHNSEIVDLEYAKELYNARTNTANLTSQTSDL